ncbi:glycosyltransferase [Bdellovibrio sp. SKB1291214]|uniref:glycosyltransferase n=1 Tax=Bdellovibrio sp. SKB1291214 TaxID=1732569 RepID=UPI000B518AB1|nr:glycosyltransferase [Bdellovibrio sp. SKB1291214]UYL08290.1 glycosyltransferase [Bdellovibrio sp. SKB1291214]
MTKPRILIIGKYFSPARGGIETASLNLAKDLAQAGCDVEIYCSNHEVRKANRFTAEFNLTRFFNFGILFSQPLYLGVFFKLLWNRRKFDYIHLQWPDLLALAAINIARPTGSLTVQWHSDIVRQKLLGKILGPMIHDVLKRASTVLVATKTYADASEVLKNYHSKIKILPYYIDAPEKTSVKNPIMPGCIISIGRHVGYKDFKTLILGYHKANLQRPLVLVGGGELLEEHKDLVASLGLQSKVHFYPAASEEVKNQLLEDCAYFALASNSRAEAFGIVLIEALSHGKPLLISNLHGSGMVEINQNNVTGLFFEVGDVADCAKKMNEMETFIHGSQVHEKCLERFESVFSRPAHVATLKTVYKF